MCSKLYPLKTFRKSCAFFITLKRWVLSYIYLSIVEVCYKYQLQCMYEWMKRIVKQLKILFKYFRYFFFLCFSSSSFCSVVRRENIKIRIQEQKKKRWESLYYILLSKGFFPLFATWYIPVSLYSTCLHECKRIFQKIRKTYKK